jgi:hypothetical protein
VGRTNDHGRGDPTTASGENRWPPTGRFPWPPSHRGAELPPELDASTAPPLVGRRDELPGLRLRWEGAVGLVAAGISESGKLRLAAELAGAVHDRGAVVLFVSGSDTAEAFLTILRRARQPTRSTLRVVQAADHAGAARLDELRALSEELKISECSCSPAPRTWKRSRICARTVCSCLKRSMQLPCEQSLTSTQATPSPRTYRRTGCLRPAAVVPASSTKLPAIGRGARRPVTSASPPDGLLRGVRSCDQSRRSSRGASRISRRCASASRHAAGNRPWCAHSGVWLPLTSPMPYFPGREKLVAELVACIVGAQLLGIFGPSGSGKSSVMREGFYQRSHTTCYRAARGGQQVLIRPGQHPLRELTDSLPQSWANAWWSPYGLAPNIRS